MQLLNLPSLVARQKLKGYRISNLSIPQSALLTAPFTQGSLCALYGGDGYPEDTEEPSLVARSCSRKILLIAAFRAADRRPYDGHRNRMQLLNLPILVARQN